MDALMGALARAQCRTPASGLGAILAHVRAATWPSRLGVFQHGLNLAKRDQKSYILYKTHDLTLHRMLYDAAFHHRTGTAGGPGGT